MMIVRRVRQLCLVPGLLLCLSAPALAGENSPSAWDPAKAGEYLDRRGEDWFKFGSARRGEGPSASSCVSCHSLLPYALARPVLRRLAHESGPTALETRILAQTKDRVSNWRRLDEASFQLLYDFDDDKKKQSRGTEAILNALVLALDDRFQGLEKPSATTKKAISNLWSTQITDGEHKGSWEWLNFGMEPWESGGGRFLGAALAAIALGSAPRTAAAGADSGSPERLDFLRNYLRAKFGTENLHNQAWMLWASTCMDGLLTPEEKQRLVAQLIAKQQAGGGWSLASLGDFARGEVAAHVKGADGYATGLVLHVLQLAGRTKDDPQIEKGLSWLRSNQDPTGAWRQIR